MEKILHREANAPLLRSMRLKLTVAGVAPGDIGTRHLSRSFVLLRSLRSDDVLMMTALGEVRRFSCGDVYTILILTGVAVILL